MRFYTNSHHYARGIDLHSKIMYACIIDRDGRILSHEEIAINPVALTELIGPYRHDIVVGVE